MNHIRMTRKFAVLRCQEVQKRMGYYKESVMSVWAEQEK